ncbi:MAG: hypothetical protein WCE81_08870 [Halobacteriota archaeon]
MAKVSEVRSELYESAKLLGDANALSKDTKATEKRILRRVVGKSVSKVLWGKLLK